MIAKSFKPVAWVAAVGAAAIGCYMLSLQVAAERSELATLERRILDTRQSIRSLQTELGTRGRLQQLERWNAEVLALAAPLAHQYLDSNVSLARFDVRQPAFDGATPVRMASNETAQTGASQPPASPVASNPSIRLASAESPVEIGAATQPVVRRASLSIEPSVSAQPAIARPNPTDLLNESTLSELGVRSRREDRRESGD